MPVRRRRDPDLAQHAAEVPYDTTVDQIAAAHEAVPLEEMQQAPAHHVVALENLEQRS
jgi:hypothetical protein